MTHQDRTRDAYNQVAAEYAAKLPDASIEAEVDRAMIRAFATMVAELGQAPILDAGCGTGRMTAFLAELGHRIEGIDLSPGMIEQAQRAHPELTFQVGSMDQLPMADQTFGGVLVWYSLIHTSVTALERTFAELRRVLVPGGLLLTGFHVGRGVRNVRAAYAKLGQDIDLDLHLFAPEDVEAAMGQEGLREYCRLIRGPLPHEIERQAIVIARRT